MTEFYAFLAGLTTGATTALGIVVAGKYAALEARTRPAQVEESAR